MVQSPLGLNTIREDAKEKVCGRAIYTDDVFVPGMLYGKVLRSPLPHAKIRKIDISRALELPGVKAVISGQDLKGLKFGLKIKDQPLLADDVVRFVGDRVAVVAATSLEIAETAVELIEVEYEELPVVEEASLDFKELVHPEMKTYEGMEMKQTSNVASHVFYAKGDIDEGRKIAVKTFSREYVTPVAHQGYMEPHSCLVDITSSEEIVVRSTNKAPYRLQRDLADLLGVPLNHIKVIVSHIGGDFGGKGSLMDVPLAYYLSRETGRPVKITMDREEELIAGNPRHASRIKITSGVDEEGNLVFWESQVIFNSGAYASLKPSGTLGGISRAAGPYKIPHVRIDGYCVYTNSVPCGHCRAPGDPQAAFAVESHIDFMSHSLGIDPADFRLKNIVREGDTSPTGAQWKDVQCENTLNTAIQVSGWRDRDKNENSGWGMALVERHIGRGSSSALIKLLADGTIVVITGITDPGTGSRTMVRQVAAHELQVPISLIKVETGDTNSAPFDTGSGSSRVTHVAGQAVRLAAIDLKNKITKKLSETWEVPQEKIELISGGIAACGEKKTPWSNLASMVGNMLGVGVYESKRPAETCFAVHVAKVAFDHVTGQVRPIKYYAVHDVGKALNPAAVEGQIEGGVVQGIGYALTEQCHWVNGFPIDKTLAEFKMPLAADIPEIMPVLVESGSCPGPYNAKSIGEIVVSPVAAALANAIFDASGFRITELPALAEKIKMSKKGDMEEGSCEGISSIRA